MSRFIVSIWMFLLTRPPTEGVPELNHYRDMTAVFLLLMQHTGTNEFNSVTSADCVPKWTEDQPSRNEDDRRDDADKKKLQSTAVGKLTLSLGVPNLFPAFGTAPPDPASPTTYGLPNREEDLLHAELKPTELFEDSINSEELERLMSYLTAPYLRLPLVLEFFSQDRVNTLLNARLREILHYCLFQPLAYANTHKLSRYVPAPRNQRNSYLGTQYGVLLHELMHAPAAVLVPLNKILADALKLCVGDSQSLFATVLLYCTRLALKVLGFIADASSRLSVRLTAHTRTLIAALDGLLQNCQDTLQRWAEGWERSQRQRKRAQEQQHSGQGSAQRGADAEVAGADDESELTSSALHAHLALLSVRPEIDVESSEIVTKKSAAHAMRASVDGLSVDATGDKDKTITTEQQPKPEKKGTASPKPESACCESENDKLSTFCSSAAHVICHYHDRMPLSHLPISTLFGALQRQRERVSSRLRTHIHTHGTHNHAHRRCCRGVNLRHLLS